MELLTGIAWEHFWQWYVHPDNTQKLKVSKFTTTNFSTGGPDYALAKLNWLAKSEIERNAIITEWFDGVGIHTQVIPHIGGGADVYYAEVTYRNERWIDEFDNLNNSYYLKRQEATIAMIIKANDIYNAKHQ